jgi:MFS family permease
VSISGAVQSKNSSREAAASASPSPEVTKRNILASTVNSFFVEAGMTLSEANVVLILLLRALGSSNFLIGMLPSLRFFGWLAPQFFVAGYLQGRPRFLPAIQVMEAIRSSFYLLTALVAFTLGPTHPRLALALFFALYLVTRAAAGASAVARGEIVARMVPPQERAMVVALRSLSGGIAGFLSGLAVRLVLNAQWEHGFASYGLLLGISGISFAVAVLALSRVREPLLNRRTQHFDWRAQLRRAPSIVKADREYALYLGVRAAWTGLEMAAPFYILYAIEGLGAPPSMGGIYISLRMSSQIISNWFWGRQCRRRGNLWVLRSSCALAMLVPLTVVLLAQTQAWFSLTYSPMAAAWLLGIAFLIHGLASSAGGISEISYLYDIAPETDRITYIGLTNTVLGPLYFLPALGGALLDRIGFVPIFGMSATFLFVAFLLSLRLGAHRQADLSCEPLQATDP